MKLAVRKKQRAAFKKLTRELEKLVEQSHKMRFYMGHEILEMNANGKIVLLDHRGRVKKRF